MAGKRPFLERLQAGEILLSDGAWGTELQRHGLEPGANPEAWNLTHPDAVKAIAQRYYQAGADMGLTNTFNGTRFRQKHYGMADKVKQINEAGARLCKEVARAFDGFVAGSMGPTGEFVEPLGLVTADEMYLAFREQANALKTGGADAAVLETIFALDEMQIAIRAAKDAGLFTMATMFFDAQNDPATGERSKDAAFGFKTMMGVTPEEAVHGMDEAGADVVGTNCGNGIENMVRLVRELRPHTKKPILMHSNAGIPKLVKGNPNPVYEETPALMAGKIQDLIAAGAQIIGGCCGTTPEHIQAFRREIDRLKK